MDDVFDLAVITGLADDGDNVDICVCRRNSQCADTVGRLAEGGDGEPAGRRPKDRMMIGVAGLSSVLFRKR